MMLHGHPGAGPTWKSPAGPDWPLMMADGPEMMTGAQERMTDAQKKMAGAGPQKMLCTGPLPPSLSQ